MRLEDFGYNAFFEESRAFLKLPVSSMTRVTSCHKDTYTVAGEQGEYASKITGKIFYTSMEKENFPVVGDWVSLSGLEENHPTIKVILPRKNILLRRSAGGADSQPIGANIDAAFIIQGLDRDYNLNRLERYLTAVTNCKIRPVLVLNKTDLISGEELREKISLIKKRFPRLHIIPSSGITDGGTSGLKKFIRKKTTYCFIGSSGVGKSSLINSLIGKETLEIGALSDYTKKGTHTTCLRSLHVLDNGGIVIDNPGMREFGMSGDLTEDDTGEIFKKLEEIALKCKYSNCSHGGEVGCAVKDALDSGELDNKKYLSYIKLQKEMQHNTMSKLEKRNKDKKFGKFCKTVMARRKKAQS
ncbi:MAG: ribosome small subunit-dependent GTPase A [Elusimicrobia bacterium HGW-Elusimicrobia-2]|nr:MAG: ribosome small subunit-dependent GTPase A [Elusimicrobia bacterium HGW-Elusimicrobia-2]